MMQIICASISDNLVRVQPLCQWKTDNIILNFHSFHHQFIFLLDSEGYTLERWTILYLRAMGGTEI